MRAVTLIANIVLAFSLGNLACNTASAQDFPYRAKVNRGGAEVRSGPAKSHYPTEKLLQGQKVEVYRHDPGGWCAVKPPKESFSLILAENIELLDDRTARVTRDGAKSWIGTSIEEVDEPLWQVRLKKGELLKIKGVVKEQYILEAGQPDWIQIAPPAGEFRWIHESQLTSTGEVISTTRKNSLEKTTGVPTPAIPPQMIGLDQPRTILSELSFDGEDTGFDTAQNQNIAQHQTMSDHIDQAERLVPPSNSQPTPASEFDIVNTSELELDHITSNSNAENFEQQQTADSTGWRKASRSIREVIPEDLSGQDLSSFESIPQVNSGNDDENEIPGVASIAQADFQRDEPSLTSASGPLTSTVQNLELELTKQVAQDSSRWNLEPIADRCQHLIQNSNDFNEQQNAQRLLDKIRRFREIQAGYATVGHSKRYDDFDSNRIGQGTSNLNGEVGKSSSPYEATGFLNELVRNSGRNKPTYVLQDENGKILHHVAPAPGINMHRYLKKKVGVVGQRGYNRQLQLPHVTAERVVELDRVRR